MREQPKGPFGRATAVAEGVAAAVRRRQREREPRVLLYRRPGDPRLLALGSKGHDAMLDLALRMVALADEADDAERESARAARREARAERRAGGDGT